jgi:hypothetical protein
MSAPLTCQSGRQLAIEWAAFRRHAQRRPTIAGKMRGQQHVYLWFAKIAIGIQIKELADPPDFMCARRILTSC